MCVALAQWSGIAGLGVGLGRVVAMALVGHLFAALLLAVQGLAGSALIRLAGWQNVLENRPERLLFSIVVGFVASNLVLMLLTMAGALNSTVLGTLGLAGITAMLWWDRP